MDMQMEMERARWGFGIVHGHHSQSKTPQLLSRFIMQVPSSSYMQRVYVLRRSGESKTI